MQPITEQMWNEIYQDIYNFLWKMCLKKGITEQECKEMMKEIKEVLIVEPSSRLSHLDT